MDILNILKLFADSPELAIAAFVLTLVAVGIQQIFKNVFKFFGKRLESIDENFKSVAKDLGGLRIDVAKVAERLEAREEVVDTRFNDLDRRVTRLEDKGDRYNETPF